MRQKIVLAMMFALLIVAGCNKPQNDPSAKLKADAQANASKKALRACNFVTLSGNITSNMTLNAANTYKISGIVVVKSPATLTIPQGTVLEGIKSATAPAWLVIEKGAKLVATGTSSAPIIFTSDQPVGSRAAGDWGGIAFAGSANNNNSNSLTIRLSTTYTFTGGGTSNTDNSGNLQFVQIHFAGAGFSTDELSKSALILNSVGTGTALDHVQVSNSGFDGIGIRGGTVNLTDVVSYNEQRTDFPISHGYQGKMQFIASMRLDNTATPANAAYAMEIANNPTTISATPLTQPVISNFTALGPNHCNSSSVNSNFISAIHFTQGGAGKIYNSVLSAWNSSANSSGLLIDETNSIAHTATNDLQFSYNSFDNSGTVAAYSNGTALWSGGCSLTMTAWINGTGSILCRESGNQFSVTTLGYDASFCNDFCGGGFTSNFVLGATTLNSPNYTWDTGSDFSHVTYRGAFGSTDFTSGWTQWCAQNVDYCM